MLVEGVYVTNSVHRDSSADIRTTVFQLTMSVSDTWLDIFRLPALLCSPVDLNLVLTLGYRYRARLSRSLFAQRHGIDIVDPTLLVLLSVFIRPFSSPLSSPSCVLFLVKSIKRALRLSADRRTINLLPGKIIWTIHRYPRSTISTFWFRFLLDLRFLCIVS